jgi:hypothetical protein
MIVLKNYEFLNLKELFLFMQCWQLGIKNKNKCSFPGCNGSNKTNGFSKSHRKLKFCPLNKQKKSEKKHDFQDFRNFYLF